MATFNGADLLGKMLASIPYEWTRSQLLWFSVARVILIPMFLLCAIPRENPILAGEGYPVLFSWLLGLTNGIVGSVPMIQAPSKVPEEHRELTGNIMTLSYTTGLTLGSLLAYVLDAFLGQPMTTKQLCPKTPATTAGTIIGNITTIANLIANTTQATVKKITKIPSLRTTATTALTTIFTTSVVGNTTGLFETVAFNATTVMPMVIANASSTISNAILQH